MIDDLSKIRKITVTGRGTYSLTLPKGAVQNLGWRKGQRVVVECKGTMLVICDFVPGEDRKREHQAVLEIKFFLDKSLLAPQGCK